MFALYCAVGEIQLPRPFDHITLDIQLEKITGSCKKLEIHRKVHFKVNLPVLLTMCKGLPIFYFVAIVLEDRVKNGQSHHSVGGGQTAAKELSHDIDDLLVDFREAKHLLLHLKRVGERGW